MATAFSGGQNKEHNMQIPELDSIALLIDEAHEARQEKPRSHLGASMLGHSCDRWLWLSFRWAVVEKFSGRMLRLFRRGHNEEQQIINDLRSIGLDVRTPSSGQSRVNFGCHVSGSIDARIEKGVPGATKTQHIAEFKTHSLKSFNALKAKGVFASKPMHWAQMQVYMLGTGLDRALYVAICKDDDRIYTERINLEPKVAQKLVERGQTIALSDRMPEPLSADATWYECKYCAGHDQCFGSKTTKQVNCRTCSHSSALSDGSWHCARWDDLIPVEAQHAGCEAHVLHPDLVPWQRKDSVDKWQAVYIVNGKELANGQPKDNVYSSRELLANPDACGDKEIQKLRSEWPGARVAG
jgi:hypothetical protein